MLVVKTFAEIADETRELNEKLLKLFLLFWCISCVSWATTI